MVGPLVAEGLAKARATRRRSRLDVDFKISAAGVLASILGLAAFLRFVLLDQNSVWYDETLIVWITQHRWQDIPALLGSTEFHPPLYYVVMKAWIGLAGPGEAAIRVPSACFGLISVYLTYALARRLFVGPVILLTTLFVAVSPFEVMIAQSARMYSMLGALVLASTLALVVSAERGGMQRWAIYVVTAALMIYTHYLAFAVLIAHAAWIFWCVRQRVGAWMVAGIVIALLYIPWIPFWWNQIVRAHAGPGGGVPTGPGILALLGLFSFGGSLFGMPGSIYIDSPRDVGEQVLIVLPFLVAAGCGVWALVADRRVLVLLGSLVSIPVGLMAVLSIAKPSFAPRWFSFLHPFYAMLLACGIVMLAEHIRGRRDRVVAGISIGLLLYSVPVLGYYFFDPQFHPYQWRGAAAIARERVQPGDFFLYGDFTNYLSFTYYFGDKYPRMLLLDYAHELSIALNPRTPELPESDRATIRGLPEHYRRVWLVVAFPFPNALLEQTLSALSGAYVLEGRVQFGRDPHTGIDVHPVVYLFRAGSPASTHP